MRPKARSTWRRLRWCVPNPNPDPNPDPEPNPNPDPNPIPNPDPNPNQVRAREAHAQSTAANGVREAHASFPQFVVSLRAMLEDVEV